MRAALWLLGLFAVSVALALFAGNNQSSVTIFWPPYRVDLSFNFVILLLAIGFVVLHVALRALSALLSLPSEARRWRAQQRERAMFVGLMESIVFFSAGRFTRARKSALTSADRAAALKHSDISSTHRARVEALAHLYACESAHSLRDAATRDEHWLIAMHLCRDKDMQDLREAALLRCARWHLDDRDPHASLERLSELPHGAARRTLALRLKLRAARMAGQTQLALDTTRLLSKHRAFTPQASASILRGLITDSLTQSHDLDQLRHAWLQLDEQERHDPDLAMLASRQFADMSKQFPEQSDVSLEMSRQCLRPVWESYTRLADTQRAKLARTLESSRAGHSREWLSSIEHAQRAAPHDPLLQYIAAHACAEQQLWGKALALFQQCAPALEDSVLARRAWLAISRLASARQDTTLEQQAIERAAHLAE